MRIHESMEVFRAFPTTLRFANRISACLNDKNKLYDILYRYMQNCARGLGSVHGFNNVYVLEEVDSKEPVIKLTRDEFDKFLRIGKKIEWAVDGHLVRGKHRVSLNYVHFTNFFGDEVSYYDGYDGSMIDYWPEETLQYIRSFSIYRDYTIFPWSANTCVNTQDPVKT